MDTRQLLTIELARQHNLKMQNTSLHIKSVGAIALCLSGLATPWMPVAAQEAASGAAAVAAPPNAASPSAPARGEAATQKPATASLKAFVVTGSRIPRSEKEGATPVTVITGQELESKGYRNVFDALQSQTQNTGFTQGADYGNTFTPAANALSLRGLGPNHTLVLVDGRRVADYPIAYDGNVNFVNLANIPSAMIDRIEILNGAASAVYGSDAIAGVVNIIMKKHIDGIEVNVKGGRTWDGGGGNGRLQVSGGKEFGALSTVFGPEIRIPCRAATGGCRCRAARNSAR